MFIPYVLFVLTFISLVPLHASAIPTILKQMDQRLASRKSQIARFFDLDSVNPLCINQCQPASDIVSTCDTDDCVCKNKHNEAMSSCLHCADEVALSPAEKEIAAYHTITFYLDVCREPVDDPSSQNTTDTSGITVNSVSPSVAPAPTQSTADVTASGASSILVTTQSAINVQTTSGIESTSNSGSSTATISTIPPLDTQAAANAQSDPPESNGMSHSTVANSLMVTIVVMLGTVLAQA